MQPWEQQAGEPGPAFAAFQSFLQLGPTRSYNEAYRTHQAQRGHQTVAVAPGNWRLWAKTWRWIDRAKAFDARNSQVADTTRVETIKSLAADQATDDWVKGRILRQLQQEQDEWRLRQRVLEQATKMLDMALIQRVDKQGPNGEVQIFTPVKWDMETMLKAVKLVADLGRLSNQMPTMPPRDAAPPADMPDDFFTKSDAKSSAMFPPGTVPEMPFNPAAKPQLGKSVTAGRTSGLIKSEKVRPQ
jgi:hypothetical protein